MACLLHIYLRYARVNQDWEIERQDVGKRDKIWEIERQPVKKRDKISKRDQYVDKYMGNEYLWVQLGYKIDVITY